MRLSRPNNRSGLTLLIVLGMLFLFSVLSVSFVIFSRQSQEASVAIARSKLRKVDYRALADDAIMSILRGGRSLNNAFTHHSLIGDIYDSNPLIGRFRPIVAGNTIAEDGVIRVAGGSADTFFFKIPLPQPPTLSSNDTATFAATAGLPNEHDALTGRLLTFREGPLQNQTFRILRYTGGETQLPLDPTNVNGSGIPLPGPLNYTLLISLAELDSDIVSFNNRRNVRVTSSITTELDASNSQSLCYDAVDFSDESTYALPYSYIINGVAFNGNGTGLTDQSVRPLYAGNGFEFEDQWGNIGKQAFTIPNPSNSALPANVNAPPGIPLQILHRYLYELDEDPQQWQRTGSNEGYDVPDFRDWFLGYYPPAITPSAEDNDIDVAPNTIIPSMHRPAVINYIANRPEYNDPANLSHSLVLRMLNLLDFATPRPLNIRIVDSSSPNNPPNPPLLVFQTNHQFSPTTTPTAVTPTLRLDFNGWPAAGPAPPGQFLQLQRFVSWLTNGPWDVDNDGEGIADSMWLDLDLPSVTGPDGQTYRSLVAVQIRDHDSRINVNTADDYTSADNTYLANRGDAFAPSLTTNLRGSSQGLGYGPSDIAVTHVLRPPPLASGARDYSRALNFFTSRSSDILGNRGRSIFPGILGNDPISSQYEFNGLSDFLAPDNVFAFPLARRPNLGVSVDRFGAPRLTTSTFNATLQGEVTNDPYELTPLSDAQADHLFSFSELDRLVSEFDSGISMLPGRLEESVRNGTINANFRRLLTTRSVELRDATLPGVTGIAARVTRGDTSIPGDVLFVSGNDPNHPNPITYVDPTDENNITNQASTPQNMAGLIRLLHESKYRRRGALGFVQITRPAPLSPLPETWAYPPFDENLHDQPLTNANIQLLFPAEFRHNLRFNLNRIIGNSASPSRQLFFRHLYCLAQLLIPRDHLLPGMDGVSDANELRRLRARTLAQWAANVIEFHDNDAIMSSYAYDEIPFGLPGANVQSNVDGNGIPTNVAGEGRLPGWVPQQGNIVWGMEFPEMIFSESLSIHDVRQINDDPSNDPDARGQYRIPQGSTFIEFFVPKPTLDTNPAGRRETAAVGPESGPLSSNLYINNSTNAPELNLGALAGNDPVWRVGFSSPSRSESVASQSTVTGFTDVQTRRLSYQVQTQAEANNNGLHPDLLRNTSMPLGDQSFERIAYFANVVPGGVVPNLIGGTTNTSNRVFRFRRGDNTVPGGSYFVIAPREGDTYFGSQTEPARSFEHLPSPQRINVDTSVPSTNMFSLDGEDLLSDKLNAYANNAGVPIATKPPTVAILAADPPNDVSDWEDIGIPYIGLNISEPLPIAGTYYDIPTDNINDNDNGNAQHPGFGNRTDIETGNRIDDGYANLRSGVLPADSLPDPMDSMNNVLALSHDMNNDGLTAEDYGTQLNVRTAYLQRLANPTLSFNPITNPYITVDVKSLDLTVFNGEETETVGGDIVLASRYRDGSSVNSTYTNNQRDISTITAAPALAMPPMLPNLPPPSNPNSVNGLALMSGTDALLFDTPTYTGPNEWDGVAVEPSYLNVALGVFDSNAEISAASFGYLNHGRPTTDGIPNGVPIDSTFRYFDGYGLPTPNSVPTYVGAPGQSIASLFWFDRPFASPHELQLVPYAGPGTFTRTFGTQFLGTVDRYRTAGDNTVGFPHLLNFFQSTDTRLTSELDLSAMPPTTDFFWAKQELGSGQLGGDLSLLFDFVETPVFYADGGIVYSADSLTDSGTSGVNSVIQQQLLADLREIFSGIQDRRRLPGKINLNTISDPAVWHALEFNYLRTDADRYQAISNANELVVGSQFFNDADSSDSDSFVDFRRGYLSTGGPFFQTNAGLENPILNGSFPSQFLGAVRPSVIGGLANSPMRNSYNAQAANASILRQAENSTSFPANEPLIDPINTDVSRNDDIYEELINVQAFEKYRRMMRLPNLTTQQSNVFEVRLTIGLFEFNPINGFGAEVLDGAGKPARHQSVYFVDRSIPVGFSPGEDINVDRTILYRRHLD